MGRLLGLSRVFFPLECVLTLVLLTPVVNNLTATDCEYEPWNNAPLSAVTMVNHSSTSEAGRKGWVGAGGLHFDDGAVYSVFSVFALNIVEYDEPPSSPFPSYSYSRLVIYDNIYDYVYIN